MVQDENRSVMHQNASQTTGIAKTQRYSASRVGGGMDHTYQPAFPSNLYLLQWQELQSSLLGTKPTVFPL